MIPDTTIPYTEECGKLEIKLNAKFDFKRFFSHSFGEPVKERDDHEDSHAGRERLNEGHARVDEA